MESVEERVGRDRGDEPTSLGGKAVISDAQVGPQLQYLDQLSGLSLGRGACLLGNRPLPGTRGYSPRLLPGR